MFKLLGRGDNTARLARDRFINHQATDCPDPARVYPQDFSSALHRLGCGGEDLQQRWDLQGMDGCFFMSGLSRKAASTIEISTPDFVFGKTIASGCAAPASLALGNRSGWVAGVNSAACVLIFIPLLLVIPRHCVGL
jgi:hypothetical protein